LLGRQRHETDHDLAAGQISDQISTGVFEMAAEAGVFEMAGAGRTRRAKRLAETFGLMAASDRDRLLERALALPNAHDSDFFGGRRPPAGVDPALVKRIDDPALRAKLVGAHIAEGLQSPKGPQKIASIVRLYPGFDAPPRTASGTPANGRSKSSAAAAAQRGLPTVDEMERLIARIREVEAAVELDLASAVDERIAHLKRALVDLDGAELEAAYHELGEALEQKRALAAQVRFETFRRVENDPLFEPRVYLRLLAR
jgi:hypothetical protein